MKICITATGQTLDDNVDPRFGRCAYFIIVDLDSMDFEAIENPNVAASGGAGIQSAQFISEKGAKAVLTGNCGPNAFQAFSAAGIEVIAGVDGPIRVAIEKYKIGSLSSASEPSVPNHFGMTPNSDPAPASGQRGMGRGMGGGGGMGRGMGRGGAGGGGGRGR